MERSDPGRHCVICSSSIESIPDRKEGPPSASDLKLANTFIQCLTLDPDQVEDLNSNPFCLECKLSLDEWDFCQNQIVRFLTRARKLKASLIAKLLESPVQSVPDTESDQNWTRIRQSVKRRFDPRVVLKKTQTANFFRETLKPLKTQKLFHYSPRKHPQKSSKLMPRIVAVSPEKFINKGKIPLSTSFSQSGVLQCGLCAFSCEDGDHGRATIVSHMKIEHYNSKKRDMGSIVRSVQERQVDEIHEDTLSCSNLAEVKLELSDGSFSKDIEMDANSLHFQEEHNPVELHKEPQSRTVGTRIKYVNAGAGSASESMKEYVYSGVQVLVVDGKHICGNCQKYFEAKNPRKCCTQHIPRCLKSTFAVKNAPPSFENTKPLRFQWFGIPITLKDRLYYCGGCKATLTRFQDVKEHIMETHRNKAAEHVFRSTQPQPPPIALEVHYSCNICGLEFTGADAGLQCQNHITTAHANSRFRPILPGPPLPIHTASSSFKPSSLISLRVTNLVPPQEQQQNFAANYSSLEPGRVMAETEDAAIIVPNLGDESEDLNRRRVDDSRNGRLDPLQLVKVEFDSLQEEMDMEEVEELLGS